MVDITSSMFRFYKEKLKRIMRDDTVDLENVIFFSIRIDHMNIMMTLPKNRG